MAAASGDAKFCCPPGSWPALKDSEEYAAEGTESFLGDLKIYSVGNQSANAIIVMPEVWGWHGRLKGICDTLAKETGFFVVMPDVMRGQQAPWDFSDFDAILRSATI